MWGVELMLRVGSAVERNCRGASRREILQVGGASAFGLSLADALRAEAAPSAGSAAADSVILIWLAGGPSQHETFDPKPDQPAEVRGPYGPIETNVSGIQICSLLPQLARVADKYTIIRSMTHGNPNHGYAPMLNGGSEHQTCYGAVVSKMLGGRGPMPPFIHLGGKIPMDAGTLGAAHNPIEIADPTRGEVNIPDSRPPARVDAGRMERRLRLIESFDLLRAQVETNNVLQARDSSYQRAVELLTRPEVRAAFDLTREPQKLRDRYGASIFGQSCLMACRLVEAGTRFIQIQWTERGGGGWDTHGTVLSGILEMEQYLCPRFDQAMATLLRDLEEKGLLKKTLIVAIAEFGRTPQINNRAGRDHWPHVFSAFVAGGGTPGGTVIGSSDPRGAYPANRPVGPGDLAATLYKIVGLNPLVEDRLKPFARGEIVHELV